jgi:FAD:protein FMN transferase
MQSLSRPAEPPAPATCRRRARPLLGTIVEISVESHLQARAVHVAIDEAFAAVERVHRLMSSHDPASALSRINALASTRPQSLDADLSRVLGMALRIARASEGAFDPCVGGPLAALGCLPASEPLADPRASWRDIELDARWVRFHRPLRVDLGGIAKGYAVDVAVDTLFSRGIHSGIVNAGGDLRAFGRTAHPIALRNPLAPAQASHAIELCDQALATSAAYFSRAGLRSAGETVLIDPGTGAPYGDNASASVIADDCMTADALTKVLLFAPAETAERVLSEFSAVALMQAPGP